jgi:hypothetical protein
MNNSSLLTADRMTHSKVVVVGLLCAILVAGIGIAAHLSEGISGGQLQAAGPVIKASKPLTAATSEGRTIR